MAWKSCTMRGDCINKTQSLVGQLNKLYSQKKKVGLFNSSFAMKKESWNIAGPTIQTLVMVHLSHFKLREYAMDIFKRRSMIKSLYFDNDIADSRFILNNT